MPVVQSASERSSQRSSVVVLEGCWKPASAIALPTRPPSLHAASLYCRGQRNAMVEVCTRTHAPDCSAPLPAPPFWTVSQVAGAVTLCLRRRFNAVGAERVPGETRTTQRPAGRYRGVFGCVGGARGACACKREGGQRHRAAAHQRYASSTRYSTVRLGRPKCPAMKCGSEGREMVGGGPHACGDGHGTRRDRHTTSRT